MTKIFLGIIAALSLALTILGLEYKATLAQLETSKSELATCIAANEQNEKRIEELTEDASDDASAVGDAAGDVRDSTNDLTSRLEEATRLREEALARSNQCKSSLTTALNTIRATATTGEITDEEVDQLNFYYAHCAMPESISRLLLVHEKTGGGVSNENTDSP